MGNNSNGNLPKFSLWVIKKIFGGINDEKVGDYYEIYNSLILDKGVVFAKIYFWKYILMSLPKFVINDIYRRIFMFRNYLLISFRNLIKEKSYSLINIIGLGAAMSIALFGYENYDFSRSYDTQHLNAKNIYRIEGILTNDKVSFSYGRVPLALAPSLASDIAGIKNYTRLSRTNGVVKFNDNVFIESVFFSDYNIFNIFTYPVSEGDVKNFSNKSSAVISNEYSIKYFAKENPIGKELVFITGNGDKHIFNIIAVIEDIPLNNSIKFNILLPNEKYNEIKSTGNNDWSVWTDAAFLQLEENYDAQQIDNKLAEYLSIQNNAMPENKFDKMYIKSLVGLANSSQELRGNVLISGVPVSAVISSIVTGIMILLVACFNFLQTSISAVSKRMKEIGIRKTLGGHRRQIIIQFFIENFILCFAALLVGIIMCYWVTDYFDSMWPTMDFNFKLFENPLIIIVLAGLLITTSFISGLYPALFISKFSPVTALKGNQFGVKKNKLKKLLFTGQFSLAMMTIVMTFILSNNTEYQRSVNLGVDRESSIVIPINNGSDHELIVNALSSNSYVEVISSTKNLAGSSWQNVKIETVGEKTDVKMLETGEKYFQNAGFKLIVGEIPGGNMTSLNQKSILVNEKLVEEFDWINPVDKILLINEENFVVAGVVENFYHNGFWQDFEPFVLKVGDKEEMKFSVIKYAGITASKMNSLVESEWKNLFAESPYSGFPIEDVFEYSTSVNESLRKGAQFNALMTILISCMGLFALVSMSVLRRKKELGIRKVLGASKGNMAKIISSEFVNMLIISSLMGCIGGYYLID